MKITNLVVGAAFIWFGGGEVISDNPDVVDWMLLGAGIIIMLSAFSSSSGSGSNAGGDGGSGWGTLVEGIAVAAVINQPNKAKQNATKSVAGLATARLCLQALASTACSAT